ncbi:hypothetical protein PG993_015116 [Apiospora rasikravindrae]|uniref:Heterokaryon incompatibility domain-containing protein n=1 Tax=Apiospora rasikravindrae TaxID=990691 RepID=A0ABR1RQ13_9PEZI
MSEPQQSGVIGAAWLEVGRQDPSRCGLGAKLINSALGAGLGREKLFKRLGYAMWIERAGRAFGLSAWLSLMVLMAEPYANPPGGERPWSQAIPMDQRQDFRQSLSDSQLRSWELLRDWWDGNYEDGNLASDARALIREVPTRNALHIHSQVSSYQRMMLRLWVNEFSPWELKTGVCSPDPLQIERWKTYEQGLTQKAGFGVLRTLRPSLEHEGQIERCGKLLPACFDSCPWLPKADRHGRTAHNLPLYLWDTDTNQTVEVQKLLEVGECIDYTCISHTWGRWKVRPESYVDIPGVEWKVPENTLFKVKELPSILRQAKEKANLPRFIWFDLICLPQDTSKPEYLSEVSRQAIIFRHASHCLAWINTITSWRNTREALRWLCLYFLLAGPESDVYGVQDILDQARHIQSPIELLISQHTWKEWFTSTWTLQEACLCPDLILCKDDWEAFEIAEGTTVSLNQLIAITASFHGRALTVINPRTWPSPVKQLFDIVRIVSGGDNLVSRLSILTSGVTRECERRRADAIMSAMGITDWYDTYFEQHREPPPEGDLVRGAYPLPFVKEVAAKLGSEFFLLMSPEDLKPDSKGTLLPFGKPGPPKLTPSNLTYGHYRFQGADTLDHPSLGNWSINSDGSVDIQEASVLQPEGAPINLSIIEATAKSSDSHTCDLAAFLQRAPRGTQRLALALNKTVIMKGIMLQSKDSERGAVAKWFRFATWATTNVAEFPPTMQLNIKVL